MNNCRAVPRIAGRVGRSGEVRRPGSQPRSLSRDHLVRTWLQRWPLDMALALPLSLPVEKILHRHPLSNVLFALLVLH